MKRLLKHLSLTDIPNVIVIASAIVIGGLRLIGRPVFDDAYKGVLLACFGLISASMFIDRRERTRVEERIMALSHNRKSINDLLEHFEDLESLELRIRNVQEIWVSGFVMANFLLPHEPLLRKWMEKNQDRRMRVLLGPDGQAGASLMEPYSNSSAVQLEKERQVSIGILTQWQEQWGARVEWRCSKVVPPHNLFITEPNEHGKAQVHLNLFGTPTEVACLFRVDALESTARFDAFRNEYKALWKAAER